MKCKICDNSENLQEYKVKEMMFGFREEFHYFECTKCNCLQIAEIPSNISKFSTPVENSTSTDYIFLNIINNF